MMRHSGECATLSGLVPAPVPFLPPHLVPRNPCDVAVVFSRLPRPSCLPVLLLLLLLSLMRWLSARALCPEPPPSLPGHSEGKGGLGAGEQD